MLCKLLLFLAATCVARPRPLETRVDGRKEKINAGQLLTPAHRLEINRKKHINQQLIEDGYHVLPPLPNDPAAPRPPAPFPGDPSEKLPRGGQHSGDLRPLPEHEDVDTTSTEELQTAIDTMVLPDGPEGNLNGRTSDLIGTEPCEIEDDAHDSDEVPTASPEDQAAHAEDDSFSKKPVPASPSWGSGDVTDDLPRHHKDRKPSNNHQSSDDDTRGEDDNETINPDDITPDDADPTVPPCISEEDLEKLVEKKIREREDEIDGLMPIPDAGQHQQGVIPLPHHKNTSTTTTTAASTSSALSTTELVTEEGNESEAEYVVPDLPVVATTTEADSATTITSNTDLTTTTKVVTTSVTTEAEEVTEPEEDTEFENETDEDADAEAETTEADVEETTKPATSATTTTAAKSASETGAEEGTTEEEEYMIIDQVMVRSGSPPRMLSAVPARQLIEPPLAPSFSRLQNLVNNVAKTPLTEEQKEEANATENELLPCLLRPGGCEVEDRTPSEVKPVNGKQGAILKKTQAQIAKSVTRLQKDLDMRTAEVVKEIERRAAEMRREIAQEAEQVIEAVKYLVTILADSVTRADEMGEGFVREWFDDASQRYVGSSAKPLDEEIKTWESDFRRDNKDAHKSMVDKLKDRVEKTRKKYGGPKAASDINEELGLVDASSSSTARPKATRASTTTTREGDLLEDDDFTEAMSDDSHKELLDSISPRNKRYGFIDSA